MNSPCPIVHKLNCASDKPLVSLVLLDWSVRERFHALDWLSKQSIPRGRYEIIWIELYDRVVPAVVQKADIVLSLNQKGLYHKHVGYNIGLVHSGGAVITVCDSDAVFPPDFIASIVNMFELDQPCEPRSLVLMHYEWRTKSSYPDDLTDIEQLKDYTWQDLWPNVGACVSVRRKDAIALGGFDEHYSFRGYMCGPYDLAWRLINAGIPEVWHDPSVALWHFAHPDPTGSTTPFSMELWKEVADSHIDGHALTAVEAFSTGRTWVLKENPELHRLRMEQRVIGTEFEKKYSDMGLKHFSRWGRLELHTLVLLEPVRRRWLESPSKILRFLWVLAKRTRDLMRLFNGVAVKPLRDLLIRMKNSIKLP